MQIVECYLIKKQLKLIFFPSMFGDAVENVNLEKYQTDDDLCKPSSALSTIDEGSGHLEEEETND